MTAWEAVKGRSDLGRDDALHAALQVTLKHMRLGQLLVPVGRQPDFGQRPPFAEDKVGIKHGLSPFSPQGKGEASGLRRGNDTNGEAQNAINDFHL